MTDQIKEQALSDFLECCLTNSFDNNDFVRLPELFVYYNKYIYLMFDVKNSDEYIDRYTSRTPYRSCLIDYKEFKDFLISKEYIIEGIKLKAKLGDVEFLK